METAGKCFEWVKEHLALDEIGIYLQKLDVAESKESIYSSLYDYLSDTVSKVPAGSIGIGLGIIPSIDKVSEYVQTKK